MSSILRPSSLFRLRCHNLISRSFAVQPFKLPDIGEGIAEVQIMEWYVKVGDRVKEMDKLCLVESDKASVEITSRYHGIVKSIFVPVNEQAKVGSVIVEIDDEQAGSSAPISSSPPAVTPAAVTPKHVQATAATTSSIQAMPSVRNLAKQLGVDLSLVTPSGKEGRITEQDVKAYHHGGVSKPVSSEEVKLSQVGLAMVKSMNDSLRIPQLTHSDEIECDRLLSAIKVLKPLAIAQFGMSNLTLTAFFIKAVSLGLVEYPLINSRLSDAQTSYTLFPHHNISVAMDSPRGLVVPNIKNVEKLSVVQIQQALLALQERAKTGRLSLDDIKGGTVSFSNIGVIGGTYTKPIIFDGQAVIGAVGRAIAMPRYNSHMVLEPRRIMNISWTADHRHIDGATVARFSNVFKQHIENPETLIAAHFK